MRRAEMLVTVSTYHAKAGEEDAFIALHEHWQQNQQAKTIGYLSGELLRNMKDPRQFMVIMRFESQESVHTLANTPEHKAWYQRVVSFTESTPTMTEYMSEWS
jgi:heme-degrading monooxygenase HmoA